MEILIIENEFTYIDTPFHYVNDVYFNNILNYTVVTKSQDIRPFNSLQDYDIVFLDISLAKSSILDGFGILKKAKEEGVTFKKLVVLTGNHLIKEKLKENNINGDVPILTKPIDFEDLLRVINI